MTVKTNISTDDGKLIIERVQDAAPILDDIANIRKLTDGKSKTGEMFHVGRIPSVVVELYCNTHGINLHEFMSNDVHVTRLMNDSNYKHLRVWDGAI